MKKPKTEWDVYVELTRCFDCNITVERFFQGKTFAVSAQQAANNVRFRVEGKTSGFYADERGDDWRQAEYIAYPSGTEVKTFEATNVDSYYS